MRASTYKSIKINTVICAKIDISSMYFKSNTAVLLRVAHNRENLVSGVRKNYS